MNINKQSSENKEAHVNKSWKIKERIENIQTKARKGLTAALIGLSLTWGLSSCENSQTFLLIFDLNTIASNSKKRTFKSRTQKETNRSWIRRNE